MLPPVVPTLRSSRHAFACGSTLFVSLRKTRFIQPHVLFTGVYLLKRLSAGFLPCAGLRLWALRQFQAFFASTASPPWRTAFSRFALVVNFGFPILASGSNCAVKPTRLRRAAYFRSLGPFKIRHIQTMPFQAAFNLSRGWGCGFWRSAGLRLVAFRKSQAFWASSPCTISVTSYHFSSATPPRWRSGFSQSVPVGKLGFPFSAFGSNLALKPTR